MYKVIRFILLLSALATVVLFWSCKENSSGPDVQGDINDAYRELENQMYIMTTSSINSPDDLNQIDFSKAYALYVKAANADVNNADANFGAGLTELLMIYADPSINNMVKRWDSVALGKNTSSFLRFGIPSGTQDMNVPVQAIAKNMAKIVQSAVVNPPLIGEMQTLMRDHFVPHIDNALAHLAVVERNSNFEFKISGKMQGDINQNPVYLDNTEVYIMDGVLRGLKAIVNQFLVYRFELSAYSTKAICEALQPSCTTFFYLASDGVARSRSVMSELTGMIGKYQNAIDYLKSETDDQSDDIIKIAQAGQSGITAANLDTAKAYLSRALNAITENQTITLNDADTSDNDYRMTINVSNLYNDPPINPKTEWLPTYTVDTTAHGNIVWRWQAQNYASLHLPDPTFNGLIVSITNVTTQNTNLEENLKRILHIDELFAHGY